MEYKLFPNKYGVYFGHILFLYVPVATHHSESTKLITMPVISNTNKNRISTFYFHKRNKQPLREQESSHMTSLSQSLYLL